MFDQKELSRSVLGRMSAFHDGRLNDSNQPSHLKQLEVVDKVQNVFEE